MSKERVYVLEIAQYLHFPLRRLRKFAKEQGLMRQVSLGHYGGRAEYVSAYGAQRLIAWARAIQGEWNLNGKDYQELLAKEAKEAAVFRHRKAKAAQTVSLAIRAAGTEDEAPAPL